jgi:hypothetical protein
MDDDAPNLKSAVCDVIRRAPTPVVDAKITNGERTKDGIPVEGTNGTSSTAPSDQQMAHDDRSMPKLGS